MYNGCRVKIQSQSSVCEMTADANLVFKNKKPPSKTVL